MMKKETILETAYRLLAEFNAVHEEAALPEVSDADIIEVDHTPYTSIIMEAGEDIT